MANKKNKSVTLLELIQDPMRVEFDTPEHLKSTGLPDKGWIQVIDGVDSIEYLALQMELFASADEDGNIKVTTQKEQLELNARLASSLVVDWDESYFGEFTKEKLLKVLSIPRFFFVQAAVQKHNEERQAFFRKCLITAFKAIEASVRVIYLTDGSDSGVADYNHFKLLDEDYKAGKLHEAFHEVYFKLNEKYMHVEYSPPRWLAPIWLCFKDIRRTLMPDTLMTYRDIDAYFNLMDINMSRHFINLILDLDYKYVSTYHNIKQDIESRPDPTPKKPD